ncbi:unnamed protein product [Trichobilharzia regenti]|nr:unnamed protein product [Trichobilharzia regenti]
MNVHFVFNNSYYRQVDGITMGSPLGPILADFFLAKLENGKLKDIIKELDMYYRYVDDTFILADWNVNIDELLLKFNNIYPSLTFTCEEEQENKLHFLDVLLSRREDGSFGKTLRLLPYNQFIYEARCQCRQQMYRIGLINSYQEALTDYRLSLLASTVTTQ